MITHAGKRTLTLENRPYLLSHAAAVGKKEGEGPLGSRFDFVTRNDRMGQKSWELAESELQRTAIDLALRKGSLRHCDLDLILAGDLLNQCIGSFLASMHSGCPLPRSVRRVLDHGAGTCARRRARRGRRSRTPCRLCLLAFLLGRAAVPISPRLRRSAHPTAQWTATAAGAAVLGAEGGSSVRMTHVLFGKMIELGVKDANNIGGCDGARRCEFRPIHFPVR